MTLVLGNLPTQQASKNAAMTLLTNSYLQRTSDVLSADGMTYTVNYVYADGDPEDETTLIVRRQYDVKNDVTRTSLRLSTMLYDDADDTVARRPVEALLAYNVPGVHDHDPVEVQTLLSCVYGCMAGSFDGTSGVPDPDIMTNLDFGIAPSFA